MSLALTGYEIGLLTSALVFIIFAIIVALVVPRSRPTFPSKYLGWFIAACIVLFAVQMTAVILLAELGEEEHEEVAQESEPNVTTPVETTPTTETTETTGTTETTETTETGAEAGDPVAGRDVFLTAGGCGSCHTLADAGTTGTIGPNLDAASPSFDRAIERVTNGAGIMPAFADTLSEQQIQDVAAYVSSAAGG
ncbi:MAG: c-type cytochrome [Actinomycetota bacterium]|nr:c-type cytochrome [Actinomycetota bacterium]